MAKLKGAAKTAFLKRMAAGRKKAKRKTSIKRRKSVSLKRRKPTKTMAKRRSRVRSVVRRRTDIKGIFKRGLLGEAVKGIGAGAIGGLVVNQFAPQYATAASTGAGFLGGGIVGALASLFVNGGLSQITGMFSGRSNGTVNGGIGV